MPEYQYWGIDRTGNKVKGTLEVKDETQLRMTLRDQGVRPLRIQAPSVWNQDLTSILEGVVGEQGVSLESLIGFTRQLYVLLSSGIPLVEGLQLIEDQATDPKMKKTAHDLKERVSKGEFLWAALTRYPKIFSKIYVALIRAGEASGNLDVMLKRLTRYLEDQDRLQKMVKGALYYPVVVLIIGFGVVGLMMMFVIPKFEELLRGTGKALPEITQLVLNISRFMAQNMFMILALVAGSGFLIYRYIRSEEGKALLDRLIFKAPLFGPLVQKSAVARFSRTLGTLLTSGVTLVDALDVCRSAMDQVVLEEAAQGIKKDVEGGKTLGVSIKKTKVFPSLAVQMIIVGESTGNLDKMLERIADIYENEVETMVAGLSKLIEPFVLVFLGGMIGAIMVAMYLPIFKLAGGGG